MTGRFSHVQSRASSLLGIFIYINTRRGRLRALLGDSRQPRRFTVIAQKECLLSVCVGRDEFVALAVDVDNLHVFVVLEMFAQLGDVDVH